MADLPDQVGRQVTVVGAEYVIVRDCTHVIVRDCLDVRVQTSIIAHFDNNRVQATGGNNQFPDGIER